MADELAQPFFVEVLRLDDLGQAGQTDQREVTAEASHRARFAAATLLIGVVPSVVADMSAGSVAPIAAAVAQGGQR